MILFRNRKTLKLIFPLSKVSIKLPTFFLDALSRLADNRQVSNLRLDARENHPIPAAHQLSEQTKLC